MEYIAELVIEVFAETILGCFTGVTENKKIPRFIRCLLVCILSILSVAVGTGMVLGVFLLLDRQWIGLLFIGIAAIQI